MSKDLGSIEGSTNAVTEVGDIFTTIEAVKGKDYTSILRITYVSFNYHKMMTELGDAFIPHESGVRNAFAVMQLAHGAGLKDMIKTLVEFYVRSEYPEGGWQELIDNKIIEISADLQTLSDKQDEYGMVIIGGSTPE